MQAFDSIEGEDPDDTKLLKEMAVEARDFISSHEWCKNLDKLYLAFRIGGIVGVFIAQMTPSSEDVDQCLWVIVGDLPPAYIVVDDNPTVADALDAYCLEMEAWVDAVNDGRSVDELIPVNTPPTREWAEELGGRLKYIRSKILPLAQASEEHA
jgi:hypothetical protein